LSLESLFVTDESGYNLTSPVVNQPARIFFTLGGEVRVVFLTGVEHDEEDLLSALTNSIYNGTPIDLLDNELPVVEQEVLRMIAGLIRIDVDGTAG
ncbi:MAG: hypothetical protein P1V20_32170, partial [Verrucomicrobiales bacterium]|nr:hypothetical protein [Verrucomicrobiales bacterium]